MGDSLQMFLKLLPLLLILPLAGPALACPGDEPEALGQLGDQDDGSVLKLLTGQYNRHSPKFYRWQINTLEAVPFSSV